MKLGIVGLPSTGKSTLFNVVMQKTAAASGYSSRSSAPNIGHVPVPDERLEKLNEMYNSKAIVPTTVEMVDIAGLVKGSGNEFLSNIREVDALVHVVRCFEDENVTHVYEEIDPVRDAEVVNLELVFADLEMIDKRLTRVEKTARTDKSFQREADILAKLKETFEEGKPARSLTWSDPDDLKLVESLTMITQKPVLYAANVSEDDFASGKITPNTPLAALEEFAKADDSQLFLSCAKLEAELALLDQEEREMFMEELGIKESGLARIIAAGYNLLGLISFLTAGPKEVRAWTVRRGSKAPQAAGKIHTDLERGFIRAEVVAYNDLMEQGSYNAAKEKGLVRVEGKEYVVQDGDVMLIRFNV